MPAKRIKTAVISGLLTAGLIFATSQMTCAEAVQDWGDDPGRRDGGHGDGGDGGDGVWHCYTGNATTDDQYLNHCTEAERVDRATYVPATTWDPKNPLPQGLR